MSKADVNNKQALKGRNILAQGETLGMKRRNIRATECHFDLSFMP